MIKTFRGKLLHGVSNMHTIRLSTNDGMTGYRIKKFQLLPQNLNNTFDSTVALWINEPDTISDNVDFDNQQMLGAGVMYESGNLGEEHIIVFDNVVINQDIYITHHQQAGSDWINYYLELEQIKLDLNEATVATLKDMRGRE